VGDADGVIVIPAEIADEVAVQATEMTIFEDYVMSAVKKGQSILGLYPPTDPQTLVDFERWRKENSL
jgi:regulator of RNase E activity RraA